MSEEQDNTAGTMDELEASSEQSIVPKRAADEINEPAKKKLKLESKGKVNRIRKANSRYWRQVCKKLNKWVNLTSPYEPSFALLYLMRTRGRVQVVWEGPEHMKEFAMDKRVLDAFKEVSLKQPSFPVKVVKVPTVPVISLHSKDVQSYRSDQLSKLIAEILNPGCKKNFYKEENKPGWYPPNVPFKAPNHRTKGKMNPVMIASDNDEIDESDVRTLQENCDGDIGESDVQNKLISMTPTQALNELYATPDWPSFLNTASRIQLAVNLTCLNDLRHQTLEDLSESFMDTITPVPNEFQALISTGDGNCFYNSMSILLSGDEQLASHMRLASILHAIDHFYHYLNTLEKEIPEVDTAVQFLFTIAGSQDNVEGRPKDNPSVTEMHTYSLRTLIRDSAKIGRDAGFLQMLFVAGATKHPIQQHCNLTEHHALYQNMVPPCCCADTYESVVHIMWTNTSHAGPGACPNHIIPLVEKHPSGIDHGVSVRMSLPCEELENTCLMWGKCLESVATQGKRLDWVICKQCQAWYHNVCVGLSPKLTKHNNFEFSCCSPPSPKDNIIVIKHPQTVKRGVLQSQLRISDVYSIYPWNGISDAAIDFYIREMLPSNPNIACLGALTYTAIVKVMSEKSGNDKDKFFQAHQRVNGKMSLNKVMIIFPCRTSGAWHWIMVAVDPALRKAFVMDSMSNLITPYSNITVKGVQKFLMAMGVINDTLTPVPIKVHQQTSAPDCGIHVIHNMTQLILNSFEGINTLEKPFSCVTLRREVLVKSHELTGKCARRIYSTSKVEAFKKSILEKISSNVEHGLKEILTEDKGRGVAADCTFRSGDFLCNYKGELITKTEGERRKVDYKEELGSYLFFFKHGGKDFCIDATEEDGSFGRLINHSRLKPNVKVKIVASDTRPYLCMFAATSIESGQELLYDYGERSKTTIENFAWLLQ